ncbi:MAG: helix-turn-helix transcriptional regulator [Erysipelotrichaceae bacterium]|nr:helix-turn-helix transcriptional regulator [Erysipelotrichaceae bacterium]MDD3808888.1 helix-turn-helix transcriptional regulator [Erysipelotrichaceae bacterium]
MERIEKTFGAQVRRIRIGKNISQEELGFRSGLSKNYISDVERGARNVSLQTIEKIARGLEIPIKELFEFIIG